MRCEYVTYHLPDYLRGTLDDGIHQDITCHLDSCASCSGHADEIRATLARLDASRLRDQPRSTGPDFLVAVNQKIDRPSKLLPAVAPQTARFAVPLFATVLVLCAFLVVLDRFPSSLPEQHAVSTSELHALIANLDTTDAEHLADDLELQASVPGDLSATIAAAQSATGTAPNALSGVPFNDLLAASADYLRSDQFIDLMPEEATNKLFAENTAH